MNQKSESIPPHRSSGLSEWADMHAPEVLGMETCASSAQQQRTGFENESSESALTSSGPTCPVLLGREQQETGAAAWKHACSERSGFSLCREFETNCCGLVRDSHQNPAATFRKLKGA